MFRRLFAIALPVSLTLTLAACGDGETPKESIRPAMVVQPQLSGELMDAYPGEVRARYEPELAFRIGGKVIKRLVDVGDTVKKDQLLAQLDPQDVRLQLEAARAQVTAAEANFSLASAERDRYKVLQGRNLVSRSQYDTAENNYRAAEARLKQARAEFNVANNQADYSQLRANQAGVIAQRTVEVGQVVGAGQTVFSLATDGEREVLIGLPEHSIKRFKVGQEVSVELWSNPGELYAGRIRELSPSADPRSRTFAARVAFNDKQVPAQLGQSARVFIAQQVNVPLAVPLSAVSAEQGKTFVWVVNPVDQTIKRTFVTVGAYGDKTVPVVEGLSASDWIIAAGGHVLLEGQKVRPVGRDNRAVKLKVEE